MRTKLRAFVFALTCCAASQIVLAQSGGGPSSYHCRDGYCPPPKKRVLRPVPIEDRPSLLDRIEPATYLWLCLAAIPIALIIMYRIHRAVQDKVGCLQGTAWEIIRLMENTTADGVRNRAKIAEDTTEKFAVDGNSRILRSSLISTDQITPDLTAAGLNLMERHANDAAQFRAFRGALRNGIAVFLSLMVHRNTDSAFIAMVEYMKRQIDRKDAPNFAELKMVFGLPVDPPEREELRRIQRKGLTFWDYFIIGRAVRQRRQVFHGFEYHPPTPGAAPVTGDAILVAMRAYLH